MVMDEKEVEDIDRVECPRCLDGSMVDKTLQVLTKPDEMVMTSSIPTPMRSKRGDAYRMG
jgi:hypothetical protein